jgi:rhodanese-related sulfurtransferase
MANAILHMAGFDNVRVFPAGYGAWEAAQETAAGTDTVTETMTETMTETVPAEVAQAVDSAFDINATVDAFLSTIPEGYFAIGQIDAVKDAMASANPLLIDVRETSDPRRRQHPAAHPRRQPRQAAHGQADHCLLRLWPARRHGDGQPPRPGL